jgi:undecaprenyl-diphosphatase
MIDTPAPLGLLEALVLGIVQGLTEFLPISSTAHLRVVPALLGWEDPGVSFTAAIQLGSVAAVVAYFRQDLTQVLRGISRAVRHGQWREPDARLGVAIVIGTLPILVVGLGIKFFLACGLCQLLTAQRSVYCHRFDCDGTFSRLGRMLRTAD